MDNILIIAVVAAILIGVVAYLHKEKKRGATCIGCPDARRCSGKCAGCTGCDER